MAKNYHVSPSSLGDVIDGNTHYKIPEYQRGYVWSDKHVEDLWSDLFDPYDNKPDKNDSEYLLGSFVLVKKQDGDNVVYDVVDGQQRLVTLTLMFCAIRNSLRNYKNTQVQHEASVIDKMVNSTRGSVMLNNPIDQVILSQIQYGIEKLSDNTSRRKSVTTIIKHYKELVSRARDLCKQYGLDDDNRCEEGIRIIRCILDDVKRKTIFVHVVIENEDYAYQAFQSLNSKGQQLNQADLIKSYLLKQSDPKSHTHTEKRWSAIMEKIPAKKQDDLLYDSMLSRGDDEYAKKDLYKFVTDTYKDDKGVNDYLRNLEEDSKIIKLLSNPDDFSGNKYLKHSIYGLKQIRASYFTRAVIAAFRKWGESDLKTRQLVDLLVKFFFMYRTICKMDIDPLKRNSRQITKQINSNDNVPLEEIFWTVTKNPRRASDDYISLEYFLKEFKRSNSMTRDTIQYILASFEYKLRESGGTHDDISGYEIEHVFPKKPKKDDWPDADKLEEHRGRLGNVTLLSKEWNIKLRNSSFEKKRNSEHGYAKSGLLLNQKYLANYTKWTEAEIEDREKKLVELASRVWDLSAYSKRAKQPSEPERSNTA